MENKKNIIALFSSDEAELYKKDIYRALALPNGFYLHFRYSERHLDKCYTSNLKLLKDRKCIIFFASGNNPKKDFDKRIISTYSIREVIIKEIYKSQNTGLIHFYLELLDFVNYRIINNQSDKIPPYCYVSKLKAMEGNANNWIDIINNIRDSFKNTLFFNINYIKFGHRIIESEFSKLENESYYYLDEETDYQIHLSYSDNSNKNGKFKIENKSSVMSS